MSWNFPDLFKAIKLQTQKLQQISGRITFPKHDGMAENQKKKRTYEEQPSNKNTAYESLWNAAKTMLRGNVQHLVRMLEKERFLIMKSEVHIILNYQPCNHARRLIIFAISSIEYWKWLSFEQVIREFITVIYQTVVCGSYLTPSLSSEQTLVLPSPAVESQAQQTALLYTSESTHLGQEPGGDEAPGKRVWEGVGLLTEMFALGSLRVQPVRTAQGAAFLGCWGPNSVIVWFLDSNKNKVRERGSAHL